MLRVIDLVENIEKKGLSLFVCEGFFSWGNMLLSGVEATQIDIFNTLLPTDSLSSETITINGESVDNFDLSAYAIPTASGNIIPARGVVKTADGQVTLTAIPVSNGGSRVPYNLSDCG